MFTKAMVYKSQQRLFAGSDHNIPHQAQVTNPEGVQQWLGRRG
jgi:hypothetical protein